MTFGEWLRARREAAKLRRGRCQNCQAVLRDDERSFYCSDDCFEQWQADTAV